MERITAKLTVRDQHGNTHELQIWQDEPGAIAVTTRREPLGPPAFKLRDGRTLESNQDGKTFTHLETGQLFTSL